jgi:hypothetical protein
VVSAEREAVKDHASAMLGGWFGRGVCATASDYPPAVRLRAEEFTAHQFLRTSVQVR